MLSPAETILEAVGKQLILNLKAAQVEKGLKASGKSAASLTLSVERQGSKVFLYIFGVPYWEQQQNGRRPDKKKGRPSPFLIDIIRNWIKVKRLAIPLSAAGAIAYNIKNEGTPVPNPYNEGGVLSEPLNKDKVSSLFVPSASRQYIEFIGSELFDV